MWRSAATGSCGATSPSAAPASRCRASTRSAAATSRPGCGGRRDPRFARRSPGRTRRRSRTRSSRSPRAPAKPSRRARREEIVASYWQRYCGKNDTIGFFGPLAWGRIEDAGPPLASRSGGARPRARGASRGLGCAGARRDARPRAPIAAGPHAERDLRRRSRRTLTPDVRARGLAALDRLEAARDALAGARRAAGSAPRSAALDATFVELTGRDATRNPGARLRRPHARLRRLHARPRCDLGPGARGRHRAGAPARLRGGALVLRAGPGDRRGGRSSAALPTGGRGPFGPVLGR